MKVLFVSLGCDKNLVDSEHMLGDLIDHGYTICDDEAEADIIVVNTCSFIADAMEESIQNIIDMGAYKTEGNLKALIVTGCLAQRFTDEILADLPEVDAIIGTNSYDELLNTIDKVLENKGIKPVVKKDLVGLPRDGRRVLTTGGHFAYLKIAEGCNKRCTYCIIPYIRGDYRSVPMEQVIAEAKQLAADGVQELIVVAQETTVYGVDLYGKKSLPDLLHKLCEIDGIKWIRILYAYPEEITDELIDCMASEPKICHYIDMPIQHCNDDILKKMGRKTNKADIMAIASRLRQAMPDISLRTTLICGFPGETEEMHRELLDFIADMKFDRLGAFAYSPEDGTVAAAWPNQVDEELKHRWVDEVMLAQKDICLSNNKTYVGRTIPTFIEGKLPEDGVFIGRTYRDTPSVDGFIFVNSDIELTSGQFVDVTVTSFDEYDLIGDVKL
ncbi:ribosomal protein S12 methylthiotransferase [Pseudobutyrivibrio sp. NOR37]|uniref:Ribosomal protein uS12 methylthiotransferase RimO n=1 Tax=Pseudobutyrivibrio xylanivorans TaxID=185007 RepID=A0A6M0LGS1_PSEXY|nr:MULTISPECIES: 30S ribosomal protein S12 methylthiotransferase RimO [Pseudobutyrivibrio]NEX01113.1 30S ribosomal protein S12 methylthiotransferase RimO [Pseudobutyrivibrio xylanivorans]SFR65095.1 ribosomal protein S12 methylthiotransferase [Pseudobutyrivibrio sp. NOR37]